MIARNSCVAIFLTYAAAYAGTGANGGNGPGFTSQNTYQLVFGSVSPASGTPFDFLATDANIDVLLSDFSTGGDSGVPPTGLRPRVLAGTAGLLLSPIAGLYTPVFTGPGPTTEPITSQFVSQLTDNIWFSNGALGQISPSNLADPSQILAIAQTLGVFSGSGTLTPSSIPAGSVDFSNITDQIANSQVQTLELAAHIDLQELDFSSPSPTSVPEPSAVWVSAIGLTAVALRRKS